MIYEGDYCVQIEIKPEIAGADLKALRGVIEAAFRNRAGSVIDSGSGDHELIFTGDEANYGCLQLGCLELSDLPEFAEKVSLWWWHDPEPDESCDLLVELAKPVY